ncbi:MAG TPA: tetratricopeptide repeat protein [Bacillota bacterium]|nr:tetratricopeptide repeat protein [Bacillota bacterium]
MEETHIYRLQSKAQIKHSRIIRILVVFVLVWLAFNQGLLHAEGANTGHSRSQVDWEGILEDVSKGQDEDLNTHLMLAVSYANLGMIPEATREFRIIESSGYQEFGEGVIRENSEKVKGSPDDIISLNLLAFAYYAFGEYEKSLECFESLMKLDPMNVWIHHYYAYSLAMVDRLDEAIDVLKAALEIDPSNDYTHLLLGLAYREKGWYVLSVLELARARRALSVLRSLAD